MTCGSAKGEYLTVVVAPAKPPALCAQPIPLSAATQITAVKSFELMRSISILPRGKVVGIADVIHHELDDTSQMVAAA
jgi:hypothetical protein